MMWSGFVSVVGSLVSGLARLRFGVHISKIGIGRIQCAMSGSNLMHYRRTKFPRYIAEHIDKEPLDTSG